MCSATTTPGILSTFLTILAINKVINALLTTGFVPVAPPSDNENKTSAQISQYCIPAPSFASSLEITFQLLMDKHTEGPMKAIVFLPAAKIAQLYHSIGKEMNGVNVFVQHSRLSQNARTRVTQEFKEAKTGIMFATDVVARGMHFDGVSHVVQVGLPDGVETYTHRIGRTGRADARGEAWIVLSPREMAILQRIEKSGMEIQVKQAPVANAAVLKLIDSATKKIAAEGDEAVAKIYLAWLGYYAGRIKQLGIEKPGIVMEANLFAKEVFGCKQPPMILKGIATKMGLKGVSGLMLK